MNPLWHTSIVIPTAVWALCYLHLALTQRRWNLFPVRIHETGRYTLWQTIFYFSHFLREVPVDLCYALTLRWTWQALDPDRVSLPAFASPRVVLVAAALFGILVVAGSLRQVGPRTALLDLFQYRERDEVVAFGSHWQMHFASTLSLMILFALPGLLWGDGHLLTLAGIFAGFFAVSLLFRTGSRALTDRRWLMHGAREIATFAILAGVPVLLPLASSFSLRGLRITPLACLAIGAVAILGAYHVLIFLRTDIRKASGSRFSTLHLFTSHFFEHALDIGFIGLLLALL